MKRAKHSFREKSSSPDLKREKEKRHSQSDSTQLEMNISKPKIPMTAIMIMLSKIEHVLFHRQDEGSWWSIFIFPEHRMLLVWKENNRKRIKFSWNEMSDMDMGNHWDCLYSIRSQTFSLNPQSERRILRIICSNGLFIRLMYFWVTSSSMWKMCSRGENLSERWFDWKSIRKCTKLT